MTLARLAFFLLLHAESLFVAEVVVETLVVRRAPVIQLHACAFLVLLATFAKNFKKKTLLFWPKRALAVNERSRAGVAGVEEFGEGFVYFFYAVGFGVVF